MIGLLRAKVEEAVFMMIERRHTVKAEPALVLPLVLSSRSTRDVMHTLFHDRKVGKSSPFMPSTVARVSGRVLSTAIVEDRD